MPTNLTFVRRRATYARLVSAKKLGFFGALALLFNAATGPGLPFTPTLFQSPGVIFTLFCFTVFSFISGFASLFIVEAMQSIPGNQHFQGDVEYATLINFYFGPVAHLAGQFVLYGALQSNAIQGIVLSAQQIDNMFVDIFKKTCGIALSGPRKGWVCVPGMNNMPSPFGDHYMLFTLGYVVVFLLSVPLGLTNLDDNMIVQYGAFCFSVAMAFQWDSAAFVNGLDSSRVPAGVSDGNAYGPVLGTVMLNLAITTIIPSWINIKRKDVNVQKSVWTTISMITVFYVVTGLILGAGFSDVSQNVLSPTLLTLGNARDPNTFLKILTKLTVYLFAFVMLIPSIPVNLIISTENLVQNQVVSRKLANFLCLVLPWILAIPLQTGDLIQPFQTWTSNIFVSTSNFIIPVIIYFQCVEFRKAYNQDRSILTAKQLDILKAIHSKSSSLVNHLGKRKNDLETASARPSEATFSGPEDSLVYRAKTNELSEAQFTRMLEEQEMNQVLKDDVPDPDQEDILAGRIDPRQPSLATRLTTISMGTRMRRNTSKARDLLSEGVAGPNVIQLKLIPPQSSPSGIEVNVIPPSSPEILQPLTEASMETTSIAEPTVAVVEPSGLLGIPEIDFDKMSDPGSSASSNEIGGSHLGRLQTLKTHPNFRTPAFRSVPIWFPLRGLDMAWIVLILTSLVTVGNIIINFLSK